jgi:diguanylate cyclase (GGDEF)-like protein
MGESMNRLRATIAAVVLLGSFSLLVSTTGVSGGRLTVWPTLVALATWIAFGIPSLAIRTGGNQEMLDMSDVALPVALVCLPAEWMPLLTTALFLIMEISRRIPPHKMLFNVGSTALSVSVASGISWALGASGHLPRGAKDVTALTAAVAAGSLLSTFLVALVVGSAQNRSVFELLGRDRRLLLLTNSLNVALGVGLVVIATYSPLTLLVIPVVGALVFTIHRKNLREGFERENSRHLLAAGRELSVASHAIASVLEVAVPRVARLLEAETVTIDVFADPDSPGPVPVEPLRAGAVAVAVAPVVEALRATGDREIDVTIAAIAADEISISSDEPVWDDTVITLNGPAGPVGVLKVTFATAVRLSTRQGQVLEQYVRSLETALMRARLQERTALEGELRAWEAGHDPLTGLSNRAGLLAQSDEVAEELTKGNAAALILVDLDRFKRVNDALGHASADRLLRHVAQTLAARARSHDTVARVEGDSFVVLLRRLPMTASVDRIAEEMLDRLTRPQEFDGITLSLDCTLGYAVAPEDGTDVGVLLARAEQALTEAKTAPGSTRRWRYRGDESDTNRIALTAELRRAIDEGQIVLHYQAQSDLKTGQIVAVEALARWEHPERGMLHPKDFIPVVESSSLARAFTLCVLDQAVRHAAAWYEMGFGESRLAVAVNLSARNLLDAGLPNDVAVVLRRHSLPAHLLVLEITETVMMSELDVVETVLGHLRNQGVRLSADDFGTGYSSMALLQRVKVNELKVDQRFVHGMLTNDDDAAIIRATVSLAHSLGIEVCAEGVEAAGQIERLRELGCDRGQGFHLARPMAERDLRKLLIADTVGDGSVVSLTSHRRRTG